MTLLDLDTSSMDYLKVTDFENLLNIYKDSNGNYYYNLNNTIYFDVNPDSIQYYICSTDMHWTLISYKLYGTTRLAWFLMKINDVKPKDAFKVVPVTTKIKYVSTTDVQHALESLMELN